MWLELWTGSWRCDTKFFQIQSGTFIPQIVNFGFRLSHGGMMTSSFSTRFQTSWPPASIHDHTLQTVIRLPGYYPAGESVTKRLINFYSQMSFTWNKMTNKVARWLKILMRDFSDVHIPCVLYCMHFLFWDLQGASFAITQILYLFKFEVDITESHDSIHSVGTSRFAVDFSNSYMMDSRYSYIYNMLGYSVKPPIR